MLYMGGFHKVILKKERKICEKSTTPKPAAFLLFRFCALLLATSAADSAKVRLEPSRAEEREE
jgi:hypothetical protein